MELVVRLKVPKKEVDQAKRLRAVHSDVQAARVIYGKFQNLLGSVPNSLAPDGLVSVKVDGKQLAEIDVEFIGAVKIIGGLRITRKRTGFDKTFLVADDVGSRELYAVNGSQVTWYGGLNGTEHRRFEEAAEDGGFMYKFIYYQKLLLSNVTDMVDVGTRYRFTQATESDVQGWK